MNPEMQSMLTLRAIVRLDKPTGGYWDGGAKDYFEFTPELERTPGVPALRWGSWEANCWFVIPFRNPKQHLAALRRKLKGKPARTITIESAVKA